MKQRQIHNNSNPTAKSNSFRIIAGNKGKPPIAERPVRAGGMPPPDDMPAGNYITVCEGAKVAIMWNKPTAVVRFRVTEGKYSGVSLAAYFDIDFEWRGHRCWMRVQPTMRDSAESRAGAG